MKNFKLKINYKANNQSFLSENLQTEHFDIIANCSENHINLVLHPKTTIEIKELKLIYTTDLLNKSVFANGYQSWTDSKEYTANDKIIGMKPLAKIADKVAKFNVVGDYNFANYTHKKGEIHGFSYGYIRDIDKYTLFGSLNEKSGYTIIYSSFANNTTSFVKELEGVNFSTEYEIMNLVKINGDYENVFDKYFSLLKINKPRIKRDTGYTSWYNYYQKINQEIIYRDLDSLSNLENKVNIFQIDDGFQTAIGDWLSIDPIKFPNGLKVIADKIHDYGMTAGLWLAPFAAQKNSQLLKDHPDWFIKNSDGTPLFAGANWGGFYALDINIAEARAYIKNVFNVVLNEWGFDLVKLDFLYAACIIPQYNKTRGQLMCEAMEFLRECVGDKYILGCGVPLFPSFGLVDYCRTGCDLNLNWKDFLPSLVQHRERVSTQNAVNNTLFRRHLDNRAFCNDPDVFLLRSENISLSFQQRKILAKLNKIFGSLLFVSDNVGIYNEEKLSTFNDTIEKCLIKIVDVKYVSKKLVFIEYYENEKHNKLLFDIVKGEIINGSL